MRVSLLIFLVLLFQVVHVFSSGNIFLEECNELLEMTKLPVKRFQLDGGFKSNILHGSDLGIMPGSKELVLTFDDGPSEKTLELARFLAKEGVPAVFFMNGKKIMNKWQIIEEIIEMKLPDGTRAHNIANHTWNHKKVNGSNFEFTACEIYTTDRIIKQLTAGINQIHFFRPPHGFWTSSEEVVAGLNNFDELSKIIGPVNWDIGGKFNDRYSSDWMCWKKNFSVEECKRRYLNEIEDLKGGVVLLHDSLDKTVEMVMGENGLVKTLKAKGYKFVSLEKNRNEIYFQSLLKSGSKYYKNFGLILDKDDSTLSPSELNRSVGASDEIYLFYSVLGDRELEIEVECRKCDRVEVYKDESTLPIFQSTVDGNKVKFITSFNKPGYKYLYSRGYKDGELIKSRISEIYVPKLF